MRFPKSKVLKAVWAQLSVQEAGRGSFIFLSALLPGSVIYHIFCHYFSVLCSCTLMVDNAPKPAAVHDEDDELDLWNGPCF